MELDPRAPFPDRWEDLVARMVRECRSESMQCLREAAMAEQNGEHVDAAFHRKGAAHMLREARIWERWATERPDLPDGLL